MTKTDKIIQIIPANGWYIMEGVYDDYNHSVTWASDPDTPVACFGLTESGQVVALIPDRERISTTLKRCDELFSKKDGDVVELKRHEE
jgi:hypothetical protein